MCGRWDESCELSEISEGLRIEKKRFFYYSFLLVGDRFIKLSNLKRMGRAGRVSCFTYESFIPHSVAANYI